MNMLQKFRASAARVIAGKSNDMSASAVVRANASALGVWTDAIMGFVPREVNPYFYESLRSALAPIDGGIGRLVTMDGILRVEGGNDKLTAAIQGMFANIAVNDLEGGMQAFYASQSNELYEQGFTIGEMVMDERGKELIGLRVADSKGVYYRRNDALQLETWYRPPSPQRFARRDGTDQIESVLRNQASCTSDWLLSRDYVQLADDRLVYAAFNPEAAGPYGVSVMRSMEFVAQILLKIQNATGHVWDRFGDPAFQLVYKTGNRSVKAEDLDKRRLALGVELAKVIDAKRKGNSADFVQAVGKDDDVTIKAIGSDGQVIELEMPARHMMEQILAKFGLPAWMLGMQWSTAERMAEQQSEIVLQESRTRFERRLTGLNKIVATWLRGRGLTWKDGDWKLAQELPRLADLLKEAQAAFLQAQTAMMLSGQVPNVPGAPGVGIPPANSNAPKAAQLRSVKVGDIEFQLPAPAHTHAHKGADGAEPWAENDPALPKIEARAVAGLVALWGDLRDTILRILKLPAAKAARGKGPNDVAWAFDPVSVLQDIADAEQVFIDAAGAEGGPLLQEAFRAWVRGLENAAAEFDVDAAIDATDAQMRQTLGTSGMTAVRDATARALRNDILSELTNGSYDGLNPREVAARLAQRFDIHNYDWERLARSEIAQAQSLGKDAQYAEMGVEEYDWVVAGDGVCPICTGYASGGPYPVGSGPLPSRDSHPNCRCTIVSHEEPPA